MRPPILLQLDCDAQPSVFDAVVAIDAGSAHLLRHGGVTPEAVPGLVHGLLFTRGLDDLKSSAIFVGGSDVAAAQRVLEAVKTTFFGPFRVSVLFDANGCNTTAAAAVLAACEGLTRVRGETAGATVTVLGGTGPVGQRVARLLLGLTDGLEVRIGSRSRDRAQTLAESLGSKHGRSAQAFATGTPDELAEALRGADAVIAAGAAGVTLLQASVPHGARVFVDLNAVPPAGIEGVDARDRAVERAGRLCWGALGVGGTKMKIHKRALQRLFESNEAWIDAEECLEIGRGLAS
jgi:hypothetical protein